MDTVILILGSITVILLTVITIKLFTMKKDGSNELTATQRPSPTILSKPETSRPTKTQKSLISHSELTSSKK